jgi:hypothetical protein
LSFNLLDYYLKSLRPLREAPPPNATSLCLVDIISFHIAFGRGRVKWIVYPISSIIFSSATSKSSRVASTDLYLGFPSQTIPPMASARMKDLEKSSCPLSIQPQDSLCVSMRRCIIHYYATLLPSLHNTEHHRAEVGNQPDQPDKYTELVEVQDHLFVFSHQYNRRPGRMDEH